MAADGALCVPPSTHLQQQTAFPMFQILSPNDGVLVRIGLLFPIYTFPCARQFQHALSGHVNQREVKMINKLPLSGKSRKFFAHIKKNN